MSGKRFPMNRSDGDVMGVGVFKNSRPCTITTNQRPRGKPKMTIFCVRDVRIHSRNENV
jgi:hypothetical protein